MTHVVSADHIRAVGETARMLLVCGAQKKCRRVDCSARNHNHVSRQRNDAAVLANNDARHFSPGPGRFESLHVRICHQRDIRKPQRRIDANYLRVRLGVDQAGIPVTRVTANALAGHGIRFIDLQPEGRVKRTQTLPREVLTELLDARLVADWRMRIGATCWWLGRIFSTPAMHVIQALSLQVIGFEVVVGNRPSWRDAAEVANLAKILATQAKQRRAIEFRVSTYVVVRVGMQRFTAFIAPLFLGLVFRFNIHGLRVPIPLFATHVAAAFDNQDFLAAWSQGIGQSATPGARADDDYVEMVFRACHVLVLKIVTSRHNQVRSVAAPHSGSGKCSASSYGGDIWRSRPLERSAAANTLPPQATFRWAGL